MKGIALTLAAALGLAAAPAHAAVNTALLMAVGGTIETATGTGSADLTASSLGGVTITLSFVNRTTSPNQLTSGQINIDNTTNQVETLDIIAGANGYLGAADAFKLTGTVGVTSGKADFAVDYFVDGADTLNGTNQTIVGTSINQFDSGQLTGPFSFSKNLTGFDAVMGPYAMAEELKITLQPGASVFVQGASMTAIPEASTWAMAVAGFALIGAVGMRKRHARFAL